ncbi:MAG: NAD(P)H-dependent oxidoreductase [bacterium]|nr:NAD(P)H-dependent oxidoreductase [bacterium]
MLFKKKKREPHILLIQGSLNPRSKTAVLVDEVAKILKERGVRHDIIDLQKLDIEFCDGRPLQKYSETTQYVYKMVEEADGYIFGMPVYCYSISGALKNFIDIMSDGMWKKAAGVLCHSGGLRSYLASVDLIKILSYESHVVSMQPIVHTYKESFKHEKVDDDAIFVLMNEMIDALLKYIKASK